MAVARKILHAIFGMFRGRTDYDGSLLFHNSNWLRQLKRERFPGTSPEKKLLDCKERIFAFCAKGWDSTGLNPIGFCFSSTSDQSSVTAQPGEVRAPG